MDKTLIDIIRELKKRRKQMAIFVGAVLFVALIVCLLLPNIYQAKTTFYAASEDLSRPDVMFGISQERAYFYGGRNEQDRLLVIAEGGVLVDSIIRRHDLYTHYDINPDQPKAHLKASSKFRENFSLQRNDLELLELTFNDEDPTFSATIANDSRELINYIAMQVIRQAQQRFKSTLMSKIETGREALGHTTYMLDSIKQATGIYDTENQLTQLAEILTESSTNLTKERARYEALRTTPGVRRDTLAIIRSRIAGLEQQVESLTRPDSANTVIDVNSLNAIIPQLKTLESQYYAVRGELVRDEVQLEKIELAMEANPPALLIVEPASVPTDKHSPRRSIIMIITAILAVIAYVLGIILYTGYEKNIKDL